MTQVAETMVAESVDTSAQVETSAPAVTDEIPDVIEETSAYEVMLMQYSSY